MHTRIRASTLPALMLLLAAAACDSPTAPVGMDVSSSTVGFAQPDWVILYSREPNSTQYRQTACVRVDGGTPCPMP